MTLILGLSGKKQSGKSSLATYLKAYFELRFNKVEFDVNCLSQSPDGEKVFLTSAGGNGSIGSWEYLLQSTVNRRNQSDTPYEPKVRIYSFADPIKEFCIEVLGIKPEQVYGTDEQKNVPTQYLWDTFPTTFRPILSTREEVVADLQTEYATNIVKIHKYKEGPMTAREVMQVFGTDIMRNMFSPLIWVNACIRKIQKDKPRIAIIADLRFPSELNSVMAAGGYVVRLDRKLFNDNHPSETSLDTYDWAKNPNAFVVPASADITTKNTMVRAWISQLVDEKTEVMNVNSCEQVSA